MILKRTHINSPLGAIVLAASDEGLAGLWFEDQRHLPDFMSWPVADSHPVLDQARTEIQSYFAGISRTFLTPRVPAWGTTFQKQVWEVLMAIPVGQTTTYGAIAAQLQNPKAVRAVGAAVGRNPWSIIVPCHRVLGADGGLTGYAGGLVRKIDLLRREGIII